MNKYIVFSVILVLTGVVGLYLFHSSMVSNKEMSPVLNNNRDSLNNIEIEEVNNLDNIVPAETSSEVITTSSNDNVMGSLTYVGISSVDPLKKRFGVTFKYVTEPQCNSLTNKDVFKILTGDGSEYLADCKGVVEHTYKTPGTYTAIYLRNNVEIAKVLAEIQ